MYHVLRWGCTSCVSAVRQQTLWIKERTLCLWQRLDSSRRCYEQSCIVMGVFPCGTTLTLRRRKRTLSASIQHKTANNVYCFRSSYFGLFWQSMRGRDVFVFTALFEFQLDYNARTYAGLQFNSVYTFNKFMAFIYVLYTHWSPSMLINAILIFKLT